MDFTFNEEQRAVQEAAEGIFAGRVTPDRVEEVEATEERFDRELWADLAAADLLGLAVPTAQGGGGYGMVELALVLEAQGRCVAPVPLWATLVLGALPVAEFGADEVRAELLPGVVAGTTVLSAALADPRWWPRPARTGWNCPGPPSPSRPPTWPTGSSSPHRSTAVWSWP